MKQEEFREKYKDMNSEEYEDMRFMFNEVVLKNVNSSLFQTLELYRTEDMTGLQAGKGPLNQMCELIVKEFIKKL